MLLLPPNIKLSKQESLRPSDGGATISTKFRNDSFNITDNMMVEPTRKVVHIAPNNVIDLVLDG